MNQDKQLKYDKAYLKMAAEWAKLSYCERKQVGALIVKNRMIISDGYNGTPSGFENVCETDSGHTKWYVFTQKQMQFLKWLDLLKVLKGQLYTKHFRHVKTVVN